jgi:Transglutaminase-like superfamily
MGAGGMLGAGIRVLRLPAHDRRCVFEAVVQVTRASLELRLLPSKRTVSLLGSVGTSVPEESVDQPQLREAALVGRAVAAAGRRLPWHPTCLRQALAAQRMLRRRGIANRLHLGVASAAELEAHAWVTVQGEPVVGNAGLERFVPLAAFK